MQAIESTVISCPYCGESFETTIDISAGRQTYIEDCYVCCRPITIDIKTNDQGEISYIDARHENE
ncbi:MAG: CPXCG motif-containing cysteine-rich protein [gamma proteobacterium symbiont of Taylorina sp.]|nr:CPXCG motif-containing cysteine-rich protein [gamma proteobacterium symbiont of Taylorina sp.]